MLRLLVTTTLLASIAVAQPTIVAHRGASADAPENTLPAFKLAWEQNADAIEGDFFLTQENRVACIHDASTQKYAKVDLDVRKSTVEELQNLDVSGRFAKRFPDTRIPTLPQVLATIPKGKQIYVEIKDGPHCVPYVLRDLARAKLDNEQIVMISFNASVIREVKKQAPEIVANLLISYRKNRAGEWTPKPDDLLATLKELKADGVSTSHGGVTKDLVDQVKAAGFGYHVWTVNNAEAARHLRDCGVDSITTDHPGKLRDWLNN